MAIGLGLLTSIALAGLSGLTGGAANYNRYSGGTPEGKNYQAYKNTKATMANDVDVYDLYNTLLIPEEREQYKKYLPKLKEHFDVYEGNGFKDGVDDLFTYAWNTYTGDKTKYDELTNLLTSRMNAYNDVSYENFLTDKANAVAASVSAPNYIDPSVLGEAAQIEVDPVKWWTGQELADLHNIDYDVNNYYDLIKQGTKANVELGNYLADLEANNASLDETLNKTAYLDAIRANKDAAAIQGTTLGAQAASDILTNVAANRAHNEVQTQVADNTVNILDPYLQADAAARVNANQYFTNLGLDLGQDIEGLYWNDSERYKALVELNAELDAAHQNAVNQIKAANASIWSNYQQAKASAEANNPYSDALTLYNFAKQAGMSEIGAQSFVNNQIFKSYTGYKNAADYYADYK